MRPILVSSCLLGLKTRYDGTDNYSPAVLEYLQKNNLTPIPVCPEQLAGLATPRPKCWFSAGDGDAVISDHGKLVNEQGEDMTKIFLHGAEECLKIARISGCQEAILQQRSPSCGTQKIYRYDQLIEGAGVTAALLSSNGLKVFANDKLPDKNS
jgi:uncharacterized protein YbbK (DUF523 family)